MICPKCNKRVKQVGQIKRCKFCNAELKPTPTSPLVIEYKTLYEDGYVKIEATSDKERYKVTFTRVMISDWIRCPSCHAKSFMNRMLKGKLEIKCRRCKAIVNYEFK